MRRGGSTAEPNCRLPAPLLPSRLNANNGFGRPSGGRAPWGKLGPMAYFVQQLINGVTLGSIYGLIAIGYTMVYGIIGMINFAHGDVFMVGAFVALITILALGAVGITAVPLALFLALLVGMALTGLYGWAVE